MRPVSNTPTRRVRSKLPVARYTRDTVVTEAIILHVTAFMNGFLYVFTLMHLRNVVLDGYLGGIHVLEVRRELDLGDGHRMLQVLS